MISSEIKAILDYGNDKIMSEIFKDLIEDYEDLRVKQKEKWERYNLDKNAIPIKKRTRPIGTPDYKANNQLVQDFPSLIVDQGRSYFIAIDVSTVFDEKLESNTKIIDSINDFNRRNDSHKLNLETALYMGVCGSCGRMLYIDGSNDPNYRGKERMMNVPPWEIIFIYNRTTNQLDYGMIYYQIKIKNIDNGQLQDVWFVEWYDSTDVYYYIESTRQPWLFQLDTQESMPHGFEGVPLIEFINNESQKGDFDRVIDNIDAYDILISDAQNECEDYRNAYMKFKGVVPDPKTMENAKLTGAFGSEDPDFDVDYITKDDNGTFLENQKNSLKENIYKFSKRIDFHDRSIITGNVSGIAMARMLQALENDIKMKEINFTAGLRREYQLLATSFRKKGIDFDPLLINFIYTRNLPMDLEYYGTIFNAFYGKIPLKLLYSLMPFIDNPEKVVNEMKEEQPNINLDSYNDLENPENE
jgi:SPP1 family phage portal protein